ncbi:MAG TPA: zinc ribbon domain-containing protein [bacterium]|nr:zinc ribbon domain-containing protein [bacterium]
MEKDGRFSKIENESVIVGITKKEKQGDRFGRLEFGADNEEPQQPEAVGKKYFPCFKCNRNNREGNLYCIYCGAIFPDVAEKTDSGLEPYEIKCPGCGKVGNKNQKRCIWCGYRFVWTDEDILREGEPVEIEINGVKYKSTDRYLPGYIREAMVKMKKENLTSADAVKILKGLHAKKTETKMVILRDIERGKEKAAAYIIMAAGGILTFAGMLSMHAKKAGLSLFFFIPGFLLVIGGMAMVSMVERDDGGNPFGRI